MWSSYAEQGYGVAIRSTYRRLTRAFTYRNPIYAGRVNYIDHDADLIDDRELYGSVAGQAPELPSRA